MKTTIIETIGIGLLALLAVAIYIVI